jgi:K+-sensing histidine kinase KdpD
MGCGNGWSDPAWLTSAKKWLSACLLPFAALLIRLGLHPWVGLKIPFFTFFLATPASAALWGFWPGIITTSISLLLAKLVCPLLSGVDIVDPNDPTNLIQFAIAASVVCLVCEWLIFARERARAAEQRLRESQQQLQIRCAQSKSTHKCCCGGATWRARRNWPGMRAR